jgi:hypothetical protein
MKYHIHGVGANWISLIMGDDSITVTTRKELLRMGGTAGITAAYVRFGMEIELQVRHHPLDAEMCSSRFYPVGNSYVLMPKPGKLISKSLTDIKKRNPADKQAWLRGIATCHEHSGRIDPLLRAMAHGIRAHVGTGREIIERNAYKVYHTTATEASMFDACVYYDHHYGLSHSLVMHAIQRLSTLQLGKSSSDSVLTAIAIHDCL